MEQGHLFVFEGIDHVGKTTVISLVKNVLNETNVNTVSYSSPGKEVKNSLGSLVYEIHHKTYPNIDCNLNPVSLQMLHVAAHLDNLQKRIIPDLSSGKTVLLDRFWWSTYAYGISSGISSSILQGFLHPELIEFEKLAKKTTVLYITRDKISSDYNKDTTKSILDVYQQLIKKSLIPVVTIHNDGTLEDLKNEILAKIKS